MKAPGCNTLLILAPSVFLIFLMGKFWYEYALLATTGHVVNGTVVRAWISTDSDGNWTPLVAYRFELGGVTYEKDQSWVPEDIYDQLKEGGPLQVLFAPDNPSINTPVSAHTLTFPIFITLFNLLWNGLLLAGYLHARKHRPTPS